MDSLHGSFRNLGVPYFGVLIIRILLYRAIEFGPFIFGNSQIQAASGSGGTLESRKVPKSAKAQQRLAGLGCRVLEFFGFRVSEFLGF